MSETISAKHDDTLKLIALVTMLIDHVGYLLYPQYFFLRIIGRLSFPIFAFLIAVGATRTRNRLAYGGRLFTIGLISQIPYNFFTHNLWYSFKDPNIFFTLLTGLLMIHFIEKKNILPAMLILLVIMPLNLSYGYYGVFLILGFFYTQTKPLGAFTLMLLLSIQYYLQTHVVVQSYAMASLGLIFSNPKLGVSIPKWLAYWFYPVHLCALFAIYFFWF